MNLTDNHSSLENSIMTQKSESSSVRNTDGLRMEEATAKSLINVSQRDRERVDKERGRF